MIRKLYLIEILNDSIQKSAGKVNTIEGLSHCALASVRKLYFLASIYVAIKGRSIMPQSYSKLRSPHINDFHSRIHAVMVR